MYLTYDEYVALGGTLSGTEYAYYGYCAQDYLDTHTMGRLKNAALIPDKVKRALLRLTGLEHGRSTTPQVTSWSNEGMSKSYAAVKSYDEQMLDIIDTLADVKIDDVPLLYRGADHA